MDDADSDGEIDDAERRDLTEYTFDALGHLTRVETATEAVDYIYNFEGLRVAKHVDNDLDGTRDHSEYFSYGPTGNDVLLDFVDPDGEATASAAELAHRYVWNPAAVDQLLAQEDIDPAAQDTNADGILDTPGDTVYPLSDHLHTNRDWAGYDAQTQTTSIIAHVVIDSFGTPDPTASTGLGPDISRYLYTSQEWDPVTGLHYYDARWYDPRIGKFISEDPIGFEAQDANLYRYVHNRVVDNVDPTGLDFIRLTTGKRVERVRSGFPTLRQSPSAVPTLTEYTYSTVRWVTETKWGRNVQAVTIGTFKTEYRREYSAYYDETFETVTRFPIKLHQRFGGGTITLTQLRKAADKIGEVAGKKGIWSLSKAERFDVIKVMVQLARQGLLDDGASDNAKALAWLAAYPDADYDYPPEPPTFKDPDSRAQTIERRLKDFTITRPTSAEWKAALDNIVLGVTRAPALHEADPENEYSDRPETNWRRNTNERIVTPGRRVIENRARSMDKQANDGMAVVRKGAHTANEVLSGLSEVEMMTWVVGGHAYFLFHVEGNPLAYYNRGEVHEYYTGPDLRSHIGAETILKEWLGETRSHDPDRPRY